MRLIKLTSDFYDRYANCTEMMHKLNRPYYYLEVSVDQLTFAIPLRHHIKHQYAFYTVNDAGLDYTKAVVISDESSISSDIPYIDTTEWRILKTHENEIFAGFAKYLRVYRKANRKPDVPKNAQIIKYSALQYFDAVLHKEKDQPGS